MYCNTLNIYKYCNTLVFIKLLSLIKYFIVNTKFLKRVKKKNRKK